MWEKVAWLEGEGDGEKNMVLKKCIGTGAGLVLLMINDKDRTEMYWKVEKKKCSGKRTGSDNQFIPEFTFVKRSLC